MTKQEQITIRIYLEELPISELAQYILNDRPVRTHMINTVMKQIASGNNDWLITKLMKSAGAE